MEPSKKAKTRQSGWLLTLNTNQRFSSPAEALPFMNGLRDALRQVLEHPRDIVQFTESALARGDSWRPDVILKVKAKQGVEYSPKNHLVHVHAVVQIKHKSTIRLDYQRIKTSVQQQLVERFPMWMTNSNGSHKRLYFNGKAFTPSQAVVDYVLKDADFVSSLAWPATTASSRPATSE